jgi:hypothetical protein
MLHPTVMEQFSQGEIASRLGCRINDTFPSLEDLGIVDGDIVQVGKDGDGFGMTAPTDQPSW